MPWYSDRSRQRFAGNEGKELTLKLYDRHRTALEALAKETIHPPNDVIRLRSSSALECLVGVVHKSETTWQDAGADPRFYGGEPWPHAS